MSRTYQTYEMKHLPADSDPRLGEAAQGNVDAAVAQTFPQIVQSVAHASPGDLAISLEYGLTPSPSPEEVPPDVRIFLVTSSRNEAMAKKAAALIESGALSTYYGLTPVQDRRVPWDQFHSLAQVVRQETLIRPSVKRDQNPNAPNDYYYQIAPFECDSGGDLLVLDSVFARLSEPALVRIAVTSVNVSDERTRLAAMLERARQINEIWHADDPDLRPPPNYFAEGPDLVGRWTYPQVALRARDPNADRVCKPLHDVYESLFSPQLLFSIQVWARSDSAAWFLASTLATATFRNGSYRVVSFARAKDAFFRKALEAAERGDVIPVPTHEKLPATDPPFRYRHLERLASAAPAEELTSVFRFPVATSHPFCCFRKSTTAHRPSEDGMIWLGYEDYPTTILGRRVRWRRHGLSPVAAPKHVGGFGATGTGKTRVLMSITEQLLEYHIPLAILELAKREHRLLKVLKRHPNQRFRDAADRLQVLTLGRESVFPPRLNPFALFRHVPPHLRVDVILRCFQAAFAMGSPMPEILKEAIERVVHRFGEHRVPALSDLADAVAAVMARKTYSGELSGNLHSALITRIRNLELGATGYTFRCRECHPGIEHVANSQSLFELCLLTEEQAALVAFLILESLYFYFLLHPPEQEGLRFVIILEELHVILSPRAQATPSESNADPASYATALLERLLCELRALGVCVIISNQTVSGIPPAILKNVGSILALKQRDDEECALIARALRLTREQQAALAELRPGEAFWTSDGYREPVQIWTPNIEKELSLCLT